MKKKIKNYRFIKAVELGIFVMMEIAFLVVLISNKTLRSGIFIDKSLFTLCTMMYAASLFILLVLLYDFIRLGNLRSESHELEKLAFLDGKTGIPNRTSCTMLFNTFTTPASMEGIGCTVIEISNIREINAQFGKTMGDMVIRDFSGILEKLSESYGFVGRNGGNEFIAVINSCSDERMHVFYDELDKALAEYNAKHNDCRLSIHSEYVLYNIEKVDTFSELVSRAYDKLRGL